jgi:hypothetical protein
MIEYFAIAYAILMGICLIYLAIDTLIKTKQLKVK